MPMTAITATTTLIYSKESASHTRQMILKMHQILHLSREIDKLCNTFFVEMYKNPYSNSMAC